MPDVIDDMDNLFRKAAENYPLNTGTGNWDKVYAALQSEPPVPEAGKKDRYRRLLLLLLLLPFVLFGLLMHTADNGRRPVSKANEMKILQRPHTETAPAGANGNGRRIIEAVPYPSGKSRLANVKSNGYQKEKGKNSRIISVTSINQNAPANKSFPGRPPASVYTEELATPGISKKKTATSLPAGQGKDISDIASNNSTDTVAASAIAAPLQQGTQMQLDDTAGKVPLDTLKHTIITPAKQKTLKKGKTVHFYAGVFAGPDISTVKLQKIYKPGFTAGITAGYRLNKKMSIESGFSVTRKYYYSEGKYFSTAKLPLPYWVKIDNVDGYCQMMDFPINVKYDLRVKSKTSWFGVIGISSYFMKKESYAYRYNSYGQPVEKKISLKESTQAWGSHANISVGYSRRIGKNGIFRIEPYIKIPFKGLGIGSLPITSSGVYLGLIRNFF